MDMHWHSWETMELHGNDVDFNEYQRKHRNDMDAMGSMKMHGHDLEINGFH